MSRALQSYTFRLFKQNNTDPFFNGVSSVFDFSTSEGLYNYDQTDTVADHNALKADWLQVGKDLSNTVDDYAATTK